MKAQGPMNNHMAHIGVQHIKILNFGLTRVDAITTGNLFWGTNFLEVV